MATNTSKSGKVVIKPIVYGNIANHFVKKREEDGHTHSWTVYIKPFFNEDMSSYVRKVQFKLHESYSNPIRIVTSPPYEIKESGWGEFEIVLKIFFKDPAEKPVTLYHHLRLFANDHNLTIAKRTIVHECYDEMIFPDPSQTLLSALNTKKVFSLFNHKHYFNFDAKENQIIEKLVKAQNKATDEIEKTRDKIMKKQIQIDILKNALLAHKQDHGELDATLEMDIC